MMDTRQVRLIRESWQRVETDPDAAARRFYAHLFAIDPSVARLFSEDMSEQRRKLMSALRTAVDHIDDSETLQPLLARLGASHADYGVERDHFDAVGSALLSTLADALGDDFTREHEQAWRAAYAYLSATMIAAMEQGR